MPTKISTGDAPCKVHCHVATDGSLFRLAHWKLKDNKHKKCKEKFLQSIGIIAIKSSETRPVIYTCRSSSRQYIGIYWHMNFSLINGCGNIENNIHGHSFVWSSTCEFTKFNVSILQKSKQTSVRKKICNFTVNRDHSNKKLWNKDGHLHLQIF